MLHSSARWTHRRAGASRPALPMLYRDATREVANVSPIHKGSQEMLSGALALPAGPSRFLIVCWIALNERLGTLNEEARNDHPASKKAEDVSAWMRRAKKRTDETEELTRQLRRIESYFGHKPREIAGHILEDAKCLTAAGQVRAAIQNGDSDEEIASFLRHYLGANSKRTRGRPINTFDFDHHAIRAFVLHGQNPRAWSYPKLADALLGCKIHKVHAHNTDCTVTLKKAVERLRKFLSELGYNVRTVK